MSATNDNSTDRLFSLVSLAVVLVGIVTGFWLLGSPEKQRLIALDRERVSDLEQITYRIAPGGASNDILAGGTLPEQLPEYITTSSQFLDPETGEPYEYKRLSDRTYELCATFSTSSENEPPARSLWEASWQHPAGRHCFELDTNGQPVSTSAPPTGPEQTGA